MTAWRFTRGLHDLGDGVYAWLQPDGSWGWSNAGLIADGDRSLLIDTLFDLRLTAEMLAAMRAATPAARRIDTLVNTHANGDHCFGNQLVEGARIVASRAGAEEMLELTAEQLARIMRSAPTMGPVGEFLIEKFGVFRFDDIVTTPPTETFDGEMTLAVGDKRVHLIEVGPAHTKGDILVHAPADRAVFTGDILFVEGHPIMWAGPVGNWIAALDRILAMDVAAIVPGHGPITDKAGVMRVRDYLVHVRDQARERYDAGLDYRAAARDMPLDAFAGWRDAERIVVTVAALYREFAGDPEPAPVAAMLADLAAFAH